MSIYCIRVLSVKTDELITFYYCCCIVYAVCIRSSYSSSSSRCVAVPSTSTKYRYSLVNKSFHCVNVLTVASCYRGLNSFALVHRLTHTSRTSETLISRSTEHASSRSGVPTIDSHVPRALVRPDVLSRVAEDNRKTERRRTSRRRRRSTTHVSIDGEETTSRPTGADLSVRPVSPRQPCLFVNANGRLLNPPPMSFNFSAGARRVRFTSRGL